MPSAILKAALLASAAAAAQTTIDLILRDGFWFGNFTIGASTRPATLLVDTGSSQTAVNPGIYKPSRDAIALNTTFEATYATTNSDGTGTITIHGQNYLDTVGLGSLLAHNQTITSVEPVETKPKHNSKPNSKLNSKSNSKSVDDDDDDDNDDDDDGLYPADGIIGLGGLCTTDDCPDNIITTLCKQHGTLDECRFGLALSSADGTGKLIVGGVQQTPPLALTTSPILSMWHLLGDVLIGGATDQDTTVVVNQGAPVLLDSGSSTIIGPVEVVKRIFQEYNVQHVVSSTPDGDRLDGYHACDSPPPVLGFNFPSAALRPERPGTPFAVPASAMIRADNGNNNCTSVLSGFDQSAEHLDGAMLWVLGQPFLQGHYVDFDMRDSDAPVVGIASLESGGYGSDSKRVGKPLPASAGVSVRSPRVAVVVLAGVAAAAMLF